MARSGKSSGDVRISVGAEVADLRRGMNEAGGLVKDFKERAERGGSTVRYMSDALTQLTGASGLAGKAVGAFGGVLTGLATGGIAGAAFAAIGSLVQVFKELRRESGESTDKIKDGLEAAKEAAKGATYELEKMAYVAAGGDGRMFDALHKQEAFITERNKLAGVEASLLEKRNALEADLESRQVKGRRSREDSIRRQIEDVDKLLAAQRKEIANLDEQREAIIRLAAEQKRADDEKAAEKERNRERSDKGFAGGYDTQIAQLNALVDAMRRAKEEAQDKSLEEYQQRTSGQRGLFDYAGDLAAGGASAKRMQDELAAAQELEKKRLKDLQGSWVKYGEAAGEAMAGLITQQKTLGQTAAAVAASTLRSVLASVRNEVLADQVAAAMKAFKANQGVPFVGLALGIAASAAAFAFGDSLLARIPSAAGGWETPSVGGPFPAILHTDEKVLNPRTAQGVDKLVDAVEGGGGVGGGVTLIFQGPGWDARSMRDLVRKGGRGFVQGVKDLSRRVR